MRQDEDRQRPLELRMPQARRIPLIRLIPLALPPRSWPTLHPPESTTRGRSSKMDGPRPGRHRRRSTVIAKDSDGKHPHQSDSCSARPAAPPSPASTSSLASPQPASQRRRHRVHAALAATHYMFPIIAVVEIACGAASLPGVSSRWRQWCWRRSRSTSCSSTACWTRAGGAPGFFVGLAEIYLVAVSFPKYQDLLMPR